MNDAGLLRAICERLNSENISVTELEAQLGVDAISAIIYENGNNGGVTSVTLKKDLVF